MQLNPVALPPGLARLLINWSKGSHATTTMGVLGRCSRLFGRSQALYARGENNVRIINHQFTSQVGKALQLTIYPTVPKPQILPLDIPQPAQCFSKGLKAWLWRRERIEDSYSSGSLCGLRPQIC